MQKEYNTPTTPIRRLYNALPKWCQQLARSIISVRNIVPYTESYKRRWWLDQVYSEFGRNQRKNIFLSIARFHHINRPIDGYYFEFGCNGAHTMRMAWDTFHYLFDYTYVGFDSFEGLPEISEIDRQEIWEKGKLAFEERKFIDVVTAHGVPSSRLLTVRGFYDESLTQDLRERMLPVKAAVVYIDCDLYTSTVPVLNWITPFLQRGSIIVFDDWNCFHGDPNRGERLAWKEYRERNPKLRFEPFITTNEAQSFVFLGQE